MVPPSIKPSAVGRYLLHDEIAAGGMGVVHVARQVGETGFSRLVAAKRLHADLALDQELVRMLSEEARVAARVRHPNVASTLDVVEDASEVLLVMEYLEGETLFRLIRASLERGQRLPLPIASAVLTGALLGLHAAHEATDERGRPLGIVHRDISPQNILVGADGLTRVLDFGVAKAASRTTVTARGAARGKLTYMAPEQARSLVVDRRADLFAAGIVLWEALAGARLFAADD
ncbi:MAG: serine/threonine protein kinase, partial [Myxococcales bacterium]